MFEHTRQWQTFKLFGCFGLPLRVRVFGLFRTPFKGSLKKFPDLIQGGLLRAPFKGTLKGLGFRVFVFIKSFFNGFLGLFGCFWSLFQEFL